MSARLNTFPPEIDFKILVVACPTFGFFVSALTAIPINGAVALIAGFRSLLPAVCVPLKIFNFLQFTFYRTTFKLKMSRCESDLFLTITLGFMTQIM